jgi:hypothetical protein
VFLSVVREIPIAGEPRHAYPIDPLTGLSA